MNQDLRISEVPHRRVLGVVRNVLFMILFAAMMAAFTKANASSPEYVKPSQANPNVQQYDTPNVVISLSEGGAPPPLAIFLPGSKGRPENVLPLLNIVAQQGYRVIGLSYNDEPSLSQVCPRNPNPQCSANFREVRTFGDGVGPVENPLDESIVSRLTDLLHYLDRTHPNAGWNTYLDPHGAPAWDRILVSGLSQGAGMAAYIAKRYPVYRVVLFSSPWDTTGHDQHPAPWLSKTSATAPERWWAERHAQEKTTDLIAHAYQALRIPPDHILIFNEGLSAEHQGSRGENPYHGSTVRNSAYADQWRQLYGKPL